MCALSWLKVQLADSQPLRSDTAAELVRSHAGLVFYNLNNSPTAAFERFSALYFTMLLYELLPFCYMSFYVWDRKFLLNDRASGLYATSAYYAAHMAASKTLW